MMYLLTSPSKPMLTLTFWLIYPKTIAQYGPFSLKTFLFTTFMWRAACRNGVKQYTLSFNYSAAVPMSGG